MSRSRFKNPCCGNTCAASEKKFKSHAHRAERRIVRMLLLSGDFDLVLPHPKEFGNPWAGPKDGKQWVKKLPWRELVKRK